MPPTIRSFASARSIWARDQARESQLAPNQDWLVWLILTGRGWGKTRTGAEWLAWQAVRNSNTRLGIIAPTWSDLRHVCIEGDSGILRTLRRYGAVNQTPGYNRSNGSIHLTNGSIIQGYSADKPDRLRGPQHHDIWADEYAAWRYPEAWDQMKLGLRLGAHPRVVATTTPRPTARIRALLKHEQTTVTRGSTFENKANLADSALADLETLYGGTRLGRQELYGEILDNAEGALWSHGTFDRWRVRKIETRIVRRVVGVDPAVTNTNESDETGIIVASIDDQGHTYVEADHTLRASPDQWARRVAETVEQYDADSIVVETNQGGDLVKQVLAQTGTRVPIRGATAVKGKAARAEPVALLYERGLVHHVGTHNQLEDQAASWIPGDTKSPDRIDALVWAVSHLTRPGSMTRSRLVTT